MPNKKKQNVRKAKPRKQTKRINTTQLVPKLRGKGFYKGFLGDAGSLLGSIGGSMFGMGELGGQLGRGAGSLLSKITGFGGYKVNSNSLLSDTGTPVFANGAEGTVVVSAREYVGDVVSSTSFVNNVFNLNPGNPSLFPRLSVTARGYEQYEFLGLIVEFRPTAGSAIASTNNALGTVIMATNYDVLDPPFANKQSMEAYQYTVSSVPCNSSIHPVECKRSLNVLDTLYVRQISQPQNADQRFYDLGLFQLATVGQQAAGVTLGEIWVSYHIRLLKPRLPDLAYARFTTSVSNSSTMVQSTSSVWSFNADTQSVNLDQPGVYQATSILVMDSNTVAATQSQAFGFDSNAKYLNWFGSSAQGHSGVTYAPWGAMTYLSGTSAHAATMTSGTGTDSVNAVSVCSAAIVVGRGGTTLTLPQYSTLTAHILSLDVWVSYLGHSAGSTNIVPTVAAFRDSVVTRSRAAVLSELIPEPDAEEKSWEPIKVSEPQAPIYSAPIVKRR